MLRRLACKVVFGLVGLAFGAAAQAQGQLRVYNWNDYVAPEALKRFEQETGIKVTYDTYDANEILDAKLRAGRTGYDLVVPTASPFLANQVRARLYRPLDRAKLTNYGNLDPALMKQLERYDPGNQHGVPWMWGTTGIGYNRERVLKIMPDAPVYSLRMIFDPEVVARFKSCGVMVLDSPTDVFPAALLHLGLDPDSKNPADLEKAAAMMAKIRPFVRRWHSSDYINALASGDACLVFGYSGDIKQAAKRAAAARKGVTVEYAIPSEGALTWIDTAAIPADAANVDNAHRFLDFMLRPDIAALNSNLVGYANGVPASRAGLDESVRSDPGVYPPAEVQRRLYSISPADLDYERLRNRAWTRVKTGR
ncbi:MAG: polyamine ABC transporter substrate-binding protein [Alphaproteobacteria bacterium]|nr:polyamine ABC transporter substrate-binding protein [Alphaproteobacteria bacterium]